MRLLQNTFLKNQYPKFVFGFFFILLFASYVNIFAIGSPYQPGATLDPACAPGDANCIVSYDLSFFKQDGNSFGATAAIGTNDSNSLVLKTNGSERARITSGGNLLIGTSTDSTFKLDILSSGGGMRFTSNAIGGGLILDNTSSVATDRYINITFRNNSTSQWATGLRFNTGKYHFFDSVNSLNRIAIGPSDIYIGGMSDAGSITGVGSIMTIKYLSGLSGYTGGTVGINTTSPAAFLHVSGVNSGDKALALFGSITASTSSNALDATSQKIEIGGSTVQSTSSEFGALVLSTKQSGTSNSVGAVYFVNSNLGTTEKRLAQVNSSTDGGTSSGNISFGTSNAGTMATKMLIKSNGNVLIQDGGTFTDGGQRLQVNGSTLLSSATTIGTFTYSNTLLSLQTDSTYSTGIVMGTQPNSNAISFVNGSQWGGIREGSSSGSLGMTIYGNRSNATNGVGLNLQGYAGGSQTAAVSILGAGGSQSSIADISSTTPVLLVQSRNSGVTSSIFTVYPSGNTIIGNGTTDAGYKLDINGTSRFQGIATISPNATNAYLYIDRPSTTYEVGIRFSTANAAGWYLYQPTTSPTSDFRIANGSGSDKFTINTAGQIGLGIAPQNSSGLITGASVTASSSIARGVYVNNTLITSANSDVLIGLDISPTFSNAGGFTNPTNLALRTSGQTLLRGSGTTNSTDALVVQGSSGTVNFRVQDGQNVLVNYLFGGASSNTASNFALRPEGIVIGGTTITGGTFLDITGSKTASSGVGRAQYIQSTLVASANNDVLNALQIAPTFTQGAFTGVTNNLIFAKGTSANDNILYLEATGSTAGFLRLQPATTAGTPWNLFATQTAINLQSLNSNGYVRLAQSGGGTVQVTTSGVAVGGTINASSTLAAGMTYNGTTAATANNDILIGLDINPTFTNGAFTGISNIALRTVTGDLRFGTTSGNVSIGNNNSAYKLEVGNNTVSGIVARFVNSTGTCDINPTTTSLSCSSDLNLKKNVTSLDASILDKVLSLNPVTYNWATESDTDPIHNGFIAQEVESIFPDLVSTDTSIGRKSLNYIGLIPYTIKALQQMNLKVKMLPDFTDQTMADRVMAFLNGVANGKVESDEITAKNKICIDGLCINREQLKTILERDLQNGNGSQPSTDTPIIEETPIEPPSTQEGAQIETGNNSSNNPAENSEAITPPVEQSNG